MNEVTKLYENANVEKEFAYLECHRGRSSICCPIDESEKDNKCMGCINSSAMEEVYEYPPFTAEKQIELIKWLAEYKNEFGLYYAMDYRINKKKWWACCDKNYEDFLEGHHDINFEQALAGLINSIWASCLEEERKQIKEILE